MSHLLSRKRIMKRLAKNVLIVLAAALVSSQAFATIDFSDDFESYVFPPDGNPIGGGWTWFLNAYPNFPVCDGYIGNYGPNPAPNSNAEPYGVSNIGEGSTGQALNVFSDYRSSDHPLGNCVEINVFQERLLTVADAGSYTFQFDTEVTDNLGEGVQAFAFIKLINPNPPYDTVLFETVSTVTGGEKSLPIDLTTDNAGLLVQWGFANVASNYLPSGRFYDNVSFAPTIVLPPPPVQPGPEGVPIPLWAFLAIAGLIAVFGGSRLRAQRKA